MRPIRGGRDRPRAGVAIRAAGGCREPSACMTLAPTGELVSEAHDTRRVATFCPMCVSACGATATVVGGRFAALEPDPSHPTGRALCVKGKAAPEIAAHPDRLLHPLRRTNPKGAADPGWERITWDEALDTVAARLRALADESGPESVVFGSCSPSTSAISDSVDWVMRLRRAFGSPNLCGSLELCGWGRYMAALYTFGAPVPGVFMPDLESAGCILFWGYNPSVARLSHATATVAARRRGARLVVVDPRRAGLASEADHWLRVRPGTDAALALALAGVMIERGWFDEDFVRRWTNGPLLVRTDTGRLLRAGDHLVAWDERDGSPVAYEPSRRGFAADHGRAGASPAASSWTASSAARPSTCSPSAAAPCRRRAPRRSPACRPPRSRPTARTLWRSRPLAYYSWSGLEQHSGTTQTIRAINVLYALTGCIDAPGGNVLFTPVPSNPSTAPSCCSPEQRAKAIGLRAAAARPAPLRVRHRRGLLRGGARGRALPGPGAGQLRGQPRRRPRGQRPRVWRRWPRSTSSCHADLFMSPTAELADIVLPVAAPFEVEALRVGFEVSQEAQSLVQLRRPVAPPRGEARSDTQIAFALATRLGLGEHFWDGDLDAGLRHRLAPSGVTLERAARRTGGRPRSARHPAPQVRRARRRGAPRLRHAERAGGAVFRGLRRRRPRAAAGVPGARDQPAVAPGPRGRVPPGPHLREGAPVLREPAPERGEPAPREPRPPGRDPPGDRRSARHRGRRLGAHRDAARQRPCAREAQRQPGPAGRLRPARLVAGLRRAGPARPRRCSAPAAST